MTIRNILCAAMVMLAPTMMMGQSPAPLAKGSPAAHSRHVRMLSRQSREGEVLVKFSAQSGVKIKTNARSKSFRSSGVSAVDKALKRIGATRTEALMPLTGAKVSARSRAYNGQPVEDTDLSGLYLVDYDPASGSADSVANILQSLDAVDYAEPNYIVYTMGDVADYTSDPMFPLQTYLQSVNMPQVWTLSGTTNVLGHRPVIAILDTGVDLTHPDLQNNIWTNALESNGAEDTDDDHNGFRDDLHGWDFVNQTGRIGDWNGHGTHCAGIAAAEGGNGVGIVGANPNALIMPVTVMQSDGTGDVATIIKGIDYAAANGADVISMSIGSYAYSVAEEQALAKAYSKCVLVAAAGNDCLPINPTTKCKICGEYGKPCFPAAFTFVIGVQAGDAIGSFSNYDEDGPVYSAFSDEKQYNYEVSAPGVGLLSTYPSGRYKSMSGTSMACPLVAGVVSKLIETKELLSHEILFGDLIHTAGSPYIDALAAYRLTDADRHPTISLLSYQLVDSLGDNDGRPDAGDTLLIYPTVRNDWGQANNIRLTLSMAENEDSSLVEFLTPEVSLGLNLSSYAKSQGLNPFRIRLSDQIVDGRKIRLQIKSTCDNALAPDSTTITLRVENGVELAGTQRQSITLYPNVHYIVTRNWGIPKDVVVTIKAGTTIKIHDGVGISNYGYINFLGTPDSMITITKGDNDLGNIGGFLNDNANYVNFNNVIFENLANITFNGHTYDHCIIRNCTINSQEALSIGGTFRDCDIYQNKIGYGLPLCYLSSGATFVNTAVHNNDFCAESVGGFGSVSRFYHSNYVGNTITSANYSTPGVYDLDESNCYGNFYDAINDYLAVEYNTTEPEIAYLSNAYLGTKVPTIADHLIRDEVDNVGWGHVDLAKMSTYAFDDAPALVEYVKVDGYDPQDQSDSLPPLGVGRHKVEVFFNRAMNQEVEPWISIGVRPPYTQKTIGDSAHWFDPYTFVAYFTIDGKSATDGLNRLRVNGFQQKGSTFLTPDERYRYNVQVQAAGSMSTGIQAEAGLGKVTLTWETAAEDFDDLLGYNLYRFTRDSAGTASDSLIVNERLIDSDQTEYVDYAVQPGTTYYYLIKEMGTDLTQHDISRTVAATPLTAQKGDANGSLTIDIADVMTEIAYLSNEDPQPFIFEAADVNSDLSVDILDVVGTIRLITQPETSIESEDDATQPAYYYVDGGVLYLQSPVVLGGIQANLLAGDSATTLATSALGGLEQLSAQTSPSSRIFLAYSMSGKTLPAGTYPIMAVSDDVEVGSLVLSTPRGRNVEAILVDDPTGLQDAIASAPDSNNVRSGIYDLQGHHMPSLPKHGIVVVNGKVIKL